MPGKPNDQPAGNSAEYACGKNGIAKNGGAYFGKQGNKWRHFLKSPIQVIAQGQMQKLIPLKTKMDYRQQV